MLSGDAHHGAAGQSRDAQAGYRVGQAATRGHHANAHFAAGAGVRVGGVSGRLLMTHVNELDFVIAQIGENREQMSPIDCETILDLVLTQYAPDQRAAIEFGHFEPPGLAVPLPLRDGEGFERPWNPQCSPFWAILPLFGRRSKGNGPCRWSAELFVRDGAVIVARMRVSTCFRHTGRAGTIVAGMAVVCPGNTVLSKGTRDGRDAADLPGLLTDTKASP